MLKIYLSTIILFIGSGSAAPTVSQNFISPLPLAKTSTSSSQYVYLPLETRLHVQQPFLKYHQSILNVPIKKIEAPKQQLYYIYPNGHVSQYESLFLKQDNPLDWWTTNAQNLWQSVSGNLQFPGPENPSSSAEGSSSGTGTMGDVEMKFKTDQQEKIIFDSRINAVDKINDEKFEKINTINFEKEKINVDTINSEGLLPASTIPLEKTNNKYYMLREQPQFYGNYNALHMAAISPLIKLQSYKTARSIDDAGADTGEYIPVPVIVDSMLSKQLVEHSRLPQVVPLVPGESVQLRSNLNIPIQSLKHVDDVVVPQFPIEVTDPVVEQVLGVASDSIVSRSLHETALSAENVARIIDDVKKSDETESVALTRHSDAENDPSIAQAKPNGLAIAGKGGIASSAPTATAITGKGGLSLAAPKATAIAGNLSDDDNDEVDSDKRII